ncbi:hypothetical protein HNR46_003572 [Haloferula luteola]|uniref:Uncharacterized protein n=1 Tax=Haloferula luteola TaxID=595692 RepID=A0A840V8D8_9BACT|nr:hypothetical protein [Haloferula luteola]
MGIPHDLPHPLRLKAADLPHREAALVGGEDLGETLSL